jgi:hypothetical protein
LQLSHYKSKIIEQECFEIVHNPEPSLVTISIHINTAAREVRIKTGEDNLRRALETTKHQCSSQKGRIKTGKDNLRGALEITNTDIAARKAESKCLGQS